MFHVKRNQYVHVKYQRKTSQTFLDSVSRVSSFTGFIGVFSAAVPELTTGGSSTQPVLHRRGTWRGESWWNTESLSYFSFHLKVFFQKLVSTKIREPAGLNVCDEADLWLVTWSKMTGNIMTDERIPVTFNFYSLTLIHRLRLHHVCSHRLTS